MADPCPRAPPSPLPGRLGYSDQGKFNLVPMSYEALDYAAGEREGGCGVRGKKRDKSPGRAGRVQGMHGHVQGLQTCRRVPAACRCAWMGG